MLYTPLYLTYLLNFPDTAEYLNSCDNKRLENGFTRGIVQK